MAYLYTEYRLCVYLLNNAARLPDSTAFPFSIHFICILFITSIHRIGLYCQAESVEQRTRLRMQKRGLKIHCLFRGNLSQKRTGTHPVLFLRRRLPGWGSGDGEVRQTVAAVVVARPRVGRKITAKAVAELFLKSRLGYLLCRKNIRNTFHLYDTDAVQQGRWNSARAGKSRFFQTPWADFAADWFGTARTNARRSRLFACCAEKNAQYFSSV